MDKNARHGGRTSPQGEHEGPGVVRIRRATTADAEAVARVHLDARRAAGDLFPPPRHRDDELVPHLLRDVFPIAEVWVGEQDGRVAGVLVLEGDLLDWLFVAPDAQGTGVGGALLDLAKRQRPAGLRLWVFASNTPALRFYERRGFRVIGGSDGGANEEGAPDLLLAWAGPV
jgi:GNAT superfamily N-acetyltransferase